MLSMDQRRSTLPSIQSTLQSEINGCVAGEKKEEEEEKPDLYMRVRSKSGVGFDWFVIKNNDAAMSQHKSRICKCGAVGSLTKPCFPPKKGLYSSTVAVGHFIYVFGGYSRTEVSYIDTRCPNNGWKICKSQMPNGRNEPYPITLVDKNNNNIEKVLLVGGFGGLRREDHHPFAQMYYPTTSEEEEEKKKESWVVIQNEPNERPYFSVFGHAVFQEGGQTIVLMHDFRSPKLFTYNVDADLWGIRWDGEFGQYYHTGALVGRIYYVLNAFRRHTVSLCGYNLESKIATCLPVTILESEKNKNKKMKKKEEEWVPFPNSYDQLPSPQLFSIGDYTLAMVWHYRCLRNKQVVRHSVHWSTFEMIQTYDDQQLKLFARPLSHVCYHVATDGRIFDCFVPVFPSNMVQRSLTTN